MTETCEPTLIQTIQQACTMMQVRIDSVRLQTGWDHPIGLCDHAGCTDNIHLQTMLGFL